MAVIALCIYAACLTDRGGMSGTLEGTTTFNAALARGAALTATPAVLRIALGIGAFSMTIALRGGTQTAAFLADLPCATSRITSPAMFFVLKQGDTAVLTKALCGRADAVPCFASLRSGAISFCLTSHTRCFAGGGSEKQRHTQKKQR
jgi:hypothetical protein